MIYERSEAPKFFFVQLKPIRFSFLQQSFERLCKECEVLDESEIHVGESEERAEFRSLLNWFRVTYLRGIGSVDFRKTCFDHVAQVVHCGTEKSELIHLQCHSVLLQGR